MNSCAKVLPPFSRLNRPATHRQKRAPALKRFRLYRLHMPDVTLMDLRLPDQSGIETTRAIRQEYPEARIIALTSYDGDQDIYRALEAGVRGYLLKEMVHTEVVRAIRVVFSGKRFIPSEVYRSVAGLLPRSSPHAP